MTTTLVPRRLPSSRVTPARPQVDAAPRLILHPVPERRTVVDGAWWPRSRDAAAELPALVAAVDERLGRTTLRVGLHRDAWRHIPHRFPARGRQVRVGWFRSTDPRVITLIFAAGEPVVLLIIPPDTAAGPAEATLDLTAQDTAGLTTGAILALACPSPGAARRAPEDSSARWENEGGSVTGQGAQAST
ncbi:DUF5994 family protein [Nonomuraea terrae]|uniref:DUF5994 family protein n=1 Tax=Nonomuraea terrae TaxID=2530383 RepID=UPI0037A5B93E